MTVQEVRKLDDEGLRATVQLAAKGGDDRAATLLFFWAQWHKIDTTKGFSPIKKTLALSRLIDLVSKNVDLSFTYGR